MSRGDAYWSARFPVLLGERYVDYADCRVRGTTAAVPDARVSRLHLVTVVDGGDVVVCRSDEGSWFLPGGTREPGETLQELARRELMEEAGTSLLCGLRCFVAEEADSTRDRPFRPHLPHPRAYWVHAVAAGRIVGRPTNPPGGETVVEVATLAPSRAADVLEQHDPIHADVVRLAGAMGLLGASP